MADLFLNKEDLNNDIIFDLLVENSDIKKDESILTTTLINIFTDGSKPYIGTALNGVVIGNKNYSINKLTVENIKLYEQGIKDSLQFLIDDNIVLSNSVETEKIGNRLNIKILQKIDKENVNNLKFSLDEQMEIIDNDFTRD
tara:strand:- start:799 stop:1224 length:426 start_codon:yes stop_codon:yes gene_type:complete